MPEPVRPSPMMTETREPGPTALDKIRPYLKAVTPAVLTLIGILVQWLINGTWDRETTAIAVTGFVAATLTYFIPNTPVPVKTTTPPSPPMPPTPTAPTT